MLHTTKSLQTTSRSASQGLLVVPRHRLSSYGRRAFSAIWNWLSDSLRDPAISRDSFKRSLKTFLVSAYSCTQRSRAFWTMRSTNLLTYLLTYFKLVTVGCVVVPGVNYKCILLVLLLIDHAQLNIIGRSIRGLAWVESRLVNQSINQSWIYIAHNAKFLMRWCASKMRKEESSVNV